MSTYTSILARSSSCFFFKLEFSGVFFKFNYFIVVQLQLSAFSPQHSSQPQLVLSIDNLVNF